MNPMSKYEQARRHLHVRTPLGDDALLLIGLAGSEGISRPFRFELDLRAARDRPLPFDQLLGGPCSIRFTTADQGERHIHGMIAELIESDFDEEFFHYRAVLRPTLWRWSKNSRCRVYQQQSVPEVLEMLLRQFDPEFQLHFAHPRRNFCVQYCESDLHFVSRLMEEEGIFYYYKHSESESKLVVSDHSLECLELPSPNEVAFDRVEGGHRPEGRITAWRKRQAATSGKATLRDYSFEMPDKNLEASWTILDQVQVGQVAHRLRLENNADLEQFEYPGAYAHHYDGKDPSGGDQPQDLQRIFDENQYLARLRMEREAAANLSVSGESTTGRLVPGYRFTLTRHPSASGNYLVVAVEHEARLHGEYRSGSPDVRMEYCNRFEAIPRDLPYRPPQATPEPNISGVQTAVVVGPAGETVFTDCYGRIKVQFHWDRAGASVGDSSCWIRVLQPHAGAGFGALAIPRIGQEVAVAFRNGKPDQPVVLGGLYNARSMPPFDLPAERARSAFKTHSHGGQASNFSGFVIDDTLQREQFQLHAEKDLTVNAENCHLVQVGNDQTELIGKNHECSVGGNQTVTVSHTQTVNTTTHHFNVGGKYVLKVGGPTAIGSGSGGGHAPWDFSVAEGHIKGDVGSKLEMVWGESSTIIIGAYVRSTLGVDTRLTLGNVQLTVGVSLDTVIGRRMEITKGNVSHRTSGRQVTTAADGMLITTPKGLFLYGRNKSELTSQDTVTLAAGQGARINMLRKAKSKIHTAIVSVIGQSGGSINLLVGKGKNESIGNGIQIDDQEVRIFTNNGASITLGAEGVKINGVNVNLIPQMQVNVNEGNNEDN